MAPSPFISLLEDATFGRIGIATESSLNKSIAKAPCECSVCHDAFFTVEEQFGKPMTHSYRDWLSDADAERRALLTTKKIHDGRDAMRARLDIFADVLMSRWRKLSQAKREALLKEAAPGLEEKQWTLPRYSYLCARLKKFNKSPIQRHRLLLPWLNVEVLKTNPAVLFALIHYRTAYPPQHWAEFDNSQINFSWHHGYFDVDFSKKCVVMFGDKYGSLGDWEEKAAHRSDTLGFPRAILVLEAQAHLMEILNSISTRILKGVDSSQPPRIEKWKGLVDYNAFGKTGVVEFWSAYTNPAFSLPREFDSNYLLSLAKTRRDATADHISHLQRDAAYMRRHLKILMATEVFKKASEAIRGVLIVQEIRLEVRNHHLWQWLEMECRHVVETRDTCRDSIHPGAALPIHYDRALSALELLLTNHVIYRARRLEWLLPFAPGFQRYWTLTTDTTQPDCIGKLRSKIGNANKEELLSNDPLYWCFFQLLALPNEHEYFDHSMLFAMLEEQFASNPSERNRLDEVMYQGRSDLAVCHEMLTLVRSHRPRNKGRKLIELARTENRQGWRRVEFGQFGDKANMGMEMEFSIVDRSKDGQVFAPDPPAVVKHKLAMGKEIGTSLLKNFYEVKPPTGPKTLAWLEKHRELRAHLEKFWESIRKTIRRDFEASDLRPTEIRDLMDVVSASLSNAYAQEKRQEEEAIVAAIRERENPQSFQKFIGSDSPAERIAPRQKKTKTKGQPSSTANDNAPARDDTAAELVGHCDAVNIAPIKVTKHSLDVFQLMFPETGDAGSKHVIWDRFVHAMADAGFVARNTGGSLVSFRNPDREDRIVFHRPHPDPKIDPVMLQAMGKRLAKWFGWERSVFILRDETN